MCGRLGDHPCWDCKVEEEDGGQFCVLHNPVDLGMAMPWESMGVDPESSFSGEGDSETTLPLVLPST